MKESVIGGGLGDERVATRDTLARAEAAIATIDALALNLRTIRRGDFPTEVKSRVREILRLSTEAAEFLRRYATKLERTAE